MYVKISLANIRLAPQTCHGQKLWLIFADALMTKIKSCITLGTTTHSIMTLSRIGSDVMLSVVCAECHIKALYIESHCAECSYAECRGAKHWHLESVWAMLGFWVSSSLSKASFRRETAKSSEASRRRLIKRENCWRLLVLSANGLLLTESGKKS